MIATRFAPSPTGRLHIGHAHSALLAQRSARSAGGRLLLRIEDIDSTRCRPEFESAILEDLAWLGIEWDGPPRRQSEHLPEYAAVLDRLKSMEVVYPCFCTRGEILAEIARAGQAPHGREGPVYPGTCRRLSVREREGRIASGTVHAFRLDAERAADLAGPLSFDDSAHGSVAVDPGLLGDVVLARRDIGTSYHVASVTDDALQGVSLIVRGDDLLEATHVHRLLQALLGYPEPAYHHHSLMTDEAGKRFAKRNRAVTIEELRRSGRSPAEVRLLAGFPARHPA
ncbi:MAG TPA: tRNA glutamyl-Q(34) synthetase GluQRS [Gammaproteobacteria bacterium]|jgi:glutamyl-Q tRNA(Asp) synthetase